jgi:hypothetical protein
MKISLVGYKDNPVSIFGELGKALAKKISGLELSQRFVPEPEDLPMVAAEAAEESDFVLVFAMLDDEKLAKFIKQKLIDVEIATKTRMLKYVVPDDFSGVNEENYFDKKEELVKEIAGLIISILFDEESFQPKDKDFSL